MYHNVSKEIMLNKHFGCSDSDISSNVIICPVWSLRSFIEYCDKVICEFSGWYKGVTLSYKNEFVTVIKSGIGSPMTGDCILALGYSNCNNIIFSGSAGAINEGYDIGDILVSKEAIIGEGFSRYHNESIQRDSFGDLICGDTELFMSVTDTVNENCKIPNTKIRNGRIFSIDSILGENEKSFEYMKEKKCDAVEMEVSAVFTASKKIHKKAVAVLVISDLPLKYRSLFEGTTKNDNEGLKQVVSILPNILLDCAINIK